MYALLFLENKGKTSAAAPFFRESRRKSEKEESNISIPKIISRNWRKARLGSFGKVQPIKYNEILLSFCPVHTNACIFCSIYWVAPSHDPLSIKLALILNLILSYNFRCWSMPDGLDNITNSVGQYSHLRSPLLCISLTNQCFVVLCGWISLCLCESQATFIIFKKS